MAQASSQQPSKEPSKASPVTVPDAAPPSKQATADFASFTRAVDCSLTRKLNADPEAKADGNDHRARQVLSGHYVPVAPTPIADPVYVAHSRQLFDDIGLDENLVHTPAFARIFAGDLSANTPPLRPRDGPPDTPCQSTARNTPTIVPLARATGTGTVAPFPPWRLSAPKPASAGRCNSRVAVRPLTAGAVTGGRCCARACASSWLRSSCMRWAYRPPGH